MPASEQDQLANLRLAYQELCKSYQAIVDFRAKLLGFLPLFSGAGLVSILNGGTPNSGPPAYAWVAGLFGFAVTLGLFLYELRGLQRAAALEQAGLELEARLELPGGQFSGQPAAHLFGVVDSRAAAWLIYSTVLAGWAYLVGVQRLGTFWAAVAAAIVAACIAFWMRRRQVAAQDAAPRAEPLRVGA